MSTRTRHVQGGAVPVRAVLVAGAFGLGLALSAWLASTGVSRPEPPAHAPAQSGQEHYRYQRVICMSPAIAEIVFALGAGPRVVAVSQNTTYPPEALERPVCGGFFNPNYEAIVALRPDLIITQGIAVDMTGFARANGVELVTLDLRDLESIFSETLKLGRALQEEARAELLCAEMRYRLAQVRAGVSGRPPVRAMLVVGREPGTLNGIFAVGPGEFLNDLIYAAGGVNVFADLATPYAVVSKETVLERAPEVIVELQGEGGDPVERLQEARRLWGGLATLPAVRNGRVYVVEATYAMIPGPRVVVLAQRLAELLHEERQ